MRTSERSGWGWSRGNVALGVLGLGTFVTGTAELVVVGILNLIAQDMAVSISTAGQLVTVYALGMSIGGPILTALTARLGRRFLLWLSLAIFIAGNVLAVVAVGFGMLIVARTVMGSVHGLFVGVALAVAAGLVPPERQGRAISVVVGGLAVSTVLGVPLGTLIGQALGWQAAFIAIVVLGVVALVSTLVLVPPVENTGTAGFTAQARHALALRVLAVLGVGFLLMCGQFTALTYLTPFLEEVTGISGAPVSAFLLAFGVATFVGTLAGGRAADSRGATTTLVVCNVVLILAFGALYLVGSTPILVALTLAAWGVVGFGLVPSLQLRVVTLAGPDANLAAALPVSAFNAGIAAGALVGGWALAGWGVAAVVFAALMICAIALPATWATRFLKVPAAGEGAAPANSPQTR